MAVAVKRKLMHKFLFSILSVIIVGMGCLTFFSYTMAKDALQDALEQQVTQVADSTVASISAWLKDRQLDVDNWSQQKVYQSSVQDTFLGKAARKGATDELTRLKEEYGYYADLLLYDKGGNVIAGSNPDMIGTGMAAGQEYFKPPVKLPEPAAAPAVPQAPATEQTRPDDFVTGVKKDKPKTEPAAASKPTTMAKPTPPPPEPGREAPCSDRSRSSDPALRLAGRHRPGGLP